MTKTWGFVSENSRLLIFLSIALIALGLLSLYKLGNLSGGLSAGEVHIATTPIGWHGIYQNPFYLPINLVRSAVFFFVPNHSQTLTRLPNALFGIITVVTFITLIRLWHSTRTALLTGLLFATSAWVLHVSRLAGNDVMYLWAVPTLLLTNILIYRYKESAFVWYGSLTAMGLILYVPGMVWLVLINLFFLKDDIRKALVHFQSFWKKSIFFIFALAWLPLLIINLARHGQLLLWLGLPAHLAKPGLLLKHFVSVPVHLFIRGPLYPDAWLERAPILDIFTLLVCVIGIYFYATHLKTARSRLLLSFLIAGWILVGLGGSVGLSLLVPILYVAVATGIAYLLHDWLRVFPFNPLARGLGFTLIGVAVSLACFYNLRSYFVVWPHNAVTRSTFHYRR